MDDGQQVTERWVSRRVYTGLHALLIGMAAFYIAVYVVIACSRLNFPYELEWIEGESLHHVQRVLDGKPLYVKPAIEFIPYMYTPLYIYGSALAAHIGGVRFFPLRLLSFLASLGCFVIIFTWVKQETRSAFYGFLSVGLFAAMYRISGAWFDLARCDSLFLLFLLGAVYLLRFRAEWQFSLLAGLLMALSFLTKQTALIVALPISLYCLIALKRRTKFVFPGTVGVVVGLTTVLLSSNSQGWYLYYVFTLPSYHPIKYAMLYKFWLYDLGVPVGVACGITFYYLAHHSFPQYSQKGLFAGLFLIGTIGAAWISRLHEGGYTNVLFPVYAMLSVYFGVGLHWLLAKKPGRILIIGLCLFQYAWLYYSPAAQIPTRADREAGDALVRQITEIAGEIWIPCHSYLAILAGKRPFAHCTIVWDVFRGPEEIKNDLMQGIKDTLRNRRFHAIMLDYPWFMPEILEYYRYTGLIFPNETVFYPVTGAKTRPEKLYILKE